MPYCPHCGNETAREISPEEKALHEAVEIERIRADKEIAIARLQARSVREELETAENVAEVQAEAEVESAVAEAELVAVAVEAGMEPEPEPEPVMIQVAEEETDGDEMPPREEHHVPSAPRQSRSYFGF